MKRLVLPLVIVLSAVTPASAQTLSARDATTAMARYAFVASVEFEANGFTIRACTRHSAAGFVCAIAYPHVRYAGNPGTFQLIERTVVQLRGSCLHVRPGGGSAFGRAGAPWCYEVSRPG